MELRCASGILHGIISDGFIEHTCKSRRCGKKPGVVVLHRFSVETGELVETLRFKDPIRKESPDDSGSCIPLRSA